LSNLSLHRPVFALLNFDSHSEAWSAHEALSKAVDDGAPVGISWVMVRVRVRVRISAGLVLGLGLGLEIDSG
jgi:hypothetical protein